MPRKISSSLILLGQLGLASLFLLGGLNKILNYNSTLADMAEAGLNPAMLLLPMVILLELGGGALVAIGRRFAPIAALALAVFTICTNLIFHDFWTMQGERATLELALFFKNISIAGALVLYAGVKMKEQSA